MNQIHTEQRRPIGARYAGWSRALAAGLDHVGVSPNAVSLAGVTIAGAGGLAFAASGVVDHGLAAAVLTIAAACIGLRCLANMLDGLVAIEHGRASPTGGIFNEFPDRLSDAVLLVGAGYGLSNRHPTLVGAGDLGWIAAAGALLVAYVRALGASLGAPQDFAGAMAKQQRMAVLAVGSVAAGVEVVWRGSQYTLGVSLVVVVLGCMVTVAGRLARLGSVLREEADRGS